MRGETAIAWEKEDFEDYRSLRLRVDTMLQTMHEERQEPLTPTRIVFAVVLLAISSLLDKMQEKLNRRMDMDEERERTSR